MAVDLNTLVELIFELDDGESDLFDLTPQLSERTAGAVALAAKLMGVQGFAVVDELVKCAQEEEAHQQAEHDLQYDGINQDGQFPHEANPE